MQLNTNISWFVLFIDLLAGKKEYLGVVRRGTMQMFIEMIIVVIVVVVLSLLLLHYNNTHNIIALIVSCFSFSVCLSLSRLALLTLLRRLLIDTFTWFKHTHTHIHLSVSWLCDHRNLRLYEVYARYQAESRWGGLRYSSKNPLVRPLASLASSLFNSFSLRSAIR